MNRTIRTLPSDIQNAEASFILDLFVSSEAQRQAICTAIQNVTKEYGINGCDVTVYNVHTDPSEAREQRVQTVPTIVRRTPSPERRIIGKLHDEAYLRMALGIPAVPAS